MEADISHQFRNYISSLQEWATTCLCAVFAGVIVLAHLTLRLAGYDCYTGSLSRANLLECLSRLIFSI